jgi:hypothetical protein
MLAGCNSESTSTSGGAPRSATPSVPVSASTTCPANLGEAGRPAEPIGGSIPADVTISWVLRCRVEVQAVPGKGSWQVRLTERADTPATALRDALNHPSEPRASGPCPAIAMIEPYFVLVDTTGHGYLPALPRTACQLPQGQAIQELNKLPFQVISRTLIRQVESR